MKLNEKLSAAIAALMITIGTAVGADEGGFEIRIFDGDFDRSAASNDNTWINLVSFSQEVIRDPDTGELTHLLKIKRKVDEHSPALVQAFLDGTVFDEMKLAVARSDGDTTFYDEFASFRTLSPVSYSLTTGGEDDGMETYVMSAVMSASGLYSVGLEA